MAKTDFDATPQIIHGDVTVAENVSSQALRAPIRALFDEFVDRYPASKPQVELQFYRRVLITEAEAAK